MIVIFFSFFLELSFNLVFSFAGRFELVVGERRDRVMKGDQNTNVREIV